MTLRLGISPCPNDTFLFDALLRGATPGPGPFALTMADVEELNQLARERALDVTKVSYHALFHLLEEYTLLRSGSALGRGCGPLLVTRDPELTLADLPELRVAIPGDWTTAHLLLRLMEPRATRVVPLLFDQVLPALMRGEADAGLVIHELRFTYQERGFHLLRDLGQWWEETTGLPIPLGGIIARRSLGPETLAALEEAIRASTARGFQDPEAALPFMALHAADMDPAVMRQHVGLYVNEFTLDLGSEGEGAICELHRRAREAGAVPDLDGSLFATPGPIPNPMGGP